MSTLDKIKAAIVRGAKRFDNWASGHTRGPIDTAPQVHDLDDYRHPMNQPFDTKMCDRPPKGWMCTRAFGHQGPCAGIRLAESESATFSRSQWDSLGEVRPSLRRPLTLPDIQRSIDERPNSPRRGAKAFGE